jgi:hypothetical protein
METASEMEKKKKKKKKPIPTPHPGRKKRRTCVSLSVAPAFMAAVLRRASPSAPMPVLSRLRVVEVAEAHNWLLAAAYRAWAWTRTENKTRAQPLTPSHTSPPFNPQQPVVG